MKKKRGDVSKRHRVVWRTDSLLLLTNKQLEEMTQQVEAHKKALKATEEELTALTKLRVKRDSIRTQYEALGLKIRYIHKKVNSEK